MTRWIPLLLIVCLVLLMCGCAAGNPRFTKEDPAGFWAGLWHGIICPFTFIISLFKDSVHIYEIQNTGHLYDLGFILGVACIFGGGSCGTSCRRKSREEREWDEIGDKVEKKVRKGIKQWLDEEDKAEVEEKEWDEIGKKVEEKIRRELRNWAEE